MPVNSTGVRLVGINGPVRLYELLDTVENAAPEKMKLVEVFHQALDLYENRRWKEAFKGFRESFSIEGGGPSALYLRRCKTFITSPPGDTWDGISNLKEK